MIVISSKEFSACQKKYFDLALHEQVYIKRGKNRFLLVYSPVSDNDDDDDTEMLALAESRMNDEFISGEAFRDYLKSLPR